MKSPLWGRQKNIFGRHKKLKQRKQQMFHNNNYKHKAAGEHKNARKRFAPCNRFFSVPFHITTLTPTTTGQGCFFGRRLSGILEKERIVFFCGIWFRFGNREIERERETQKNFPHVMFTIPRYRLAMREGWIKGGREERKSAERTLQRVLVLCRSCLSFYALRNHRRTID